MFFRNIQSIFPVTKYISGYKVYFRLQNFLSQVDNMEFKNFHQQVNSYNNVFFIQA